MQILWLRNDLRLHDHPGFHLARAKNEPLSIIYIIPKQWQAWCAASTGIPMIDAGLVELRTTGFLSNRLRQNMASYFIHQLQLDWRWGARWFEQHLIDFDVASNRSEEHTSELQSPD